MKYIPQFRGPSIVLLASFHIAIFTAGLVTGSVLRHGSSFVTPFAAADQLRMFFTQSPLAVRVSNFFLFGSAVPFGIFAVTTVSRLRFMGVRAAGTNITLLGGLTATVALFFSAISGWILSVPDISDSIAVVKALYFFSFLCGGILYAIGFGLFASGVSVTGHLTRLLPRWLTLLGIVVAITGELSWFSLITYPANFFIPITRFVGFIWMVLAAIWLTRGRKAQLASAG
ncbi:MAG TPA: hypothetical protein VKZ53_20900 [Candidatus Angelobacter sp.]|nr:hypothetical protein [Candidatus Angelobacter sp.]